MAKEPRRRPVGATSSQGDRVMALVELARGRVRPEPEENVGLPIDVCMEGVADLVDADEIRVAFQILSYSLLDYDIRLTDDDFLEASAVAAGLGIALDRFVLPLRVLVDSPDRVVLTGNVN